MIPRCLACVTRWIMLSLSYIENTGRGEILDMEKKITHLRHLYLATFKKTVTFVDQKFR